MFTTSLIIGLLAGCFGGMVGLGGGVIMIPLMVSKLGMSQHKAHGTSMVALIFTGLFGAIAYATKAEVEFLSALILATTAICTASAGAKFANSLPEWKLKRSFGAFLIFVSLMLVTKPFLHGLLPTVSDSLGRYGILLITGVVAGFFAGMMGVGGGTIMVPPMVLLLGFSQHMAHGTALLTMVPAAVAGAITHLRLGNVYKPPLAGLVVGLSIGATAGGMIALQLPEGALRMVFAVTLTWLGIRYLRTKAR